MAMAHRDPLNDFERDFDEVNEASCDCAMVGPALFLEHLFGGWWASHDAPRAPPIAPARPAKSQWMSNDMDFEMEPSSVDSFDRYQEEITHPQNPVSTRTARSNSRLFGNRDAMSVEALQIPVEAPQLARQRVRSEASALHKIKNERRRANNSSGGMRRNVSFGSTAALRIESREELAESLKEHLWYDSRNISSFVMDELQRRKAIGITSTNALCDNQVEVGS